MSRIDETIFVFDRTVKLIPTDESLARKRSPDVFAYTDLVAVQNDFILRSHGSTILTLQSSAT